MQLNIFEPNFSFSSFFFNKSSCLSTHETCAHANTQTHNQMAKPKRTKQFICVLII